MFYLFILKIHTSKKYLVARITSYHFLINILFFSRQSYFEKKDKIIIAIIVPSFAYHYTTGCDFHCRTFLKFIKTLVNFLVSCIPNKNEFAHFYTLLKLESDFKVILKKLFLCVKVLKSYIFLFVHYNFYALHFRNHKNLAHFAHLIRKKKKEKLTQNECFPNVR